jgi:RNA polymerase sigma-70 factor (family 1)
MLTPAEESYQSMLITRLRQGNKDAFAEIYGLYSRKIYLRVYKLVKDKDVTDEIVQELFIKIWELHRSIDETKSFQSYLYTIAQNMVYNHFRKLASDNKLIQHLITGTDQVTDVETLLESKEISGLVKTAIDQLSPQRKMAFTLCKLEGKSYKEVSELMGISPATINSHITQSLQHIRNYILKHQGLSVLTLSALLQVIREL